MSYRPALDAEAYSGALERDDHAPSASDRAAWFGGLFCLFMFGQGWAAPLTGYKISDADSALLRDAFLPAYLVILGLIALRPWDLTRTLGREALLVALLAVVFASTLWSIDPAATLRRAVALAFTTLAGWVIASRWSWAALAELIGACFAIDGVLSLILGALVPDMGRMSELFPGAWRGLWLEKNGLAGMMSIGFMAQVAAAIYVPRRRWLWIAMALVSFGLVVLSQSKTGLVSMMFGLLIMGLCLFCRRGPVASILAIWAAVAGAIAVAAVLILAPDLLLGLLGKDATLTGRTVLWSAALRQLAHQPILGFGYGVLWDHTSTWYPGAWITHDAGFQAGHAHNGWLETALGMGLVGLSVWTLYFLQVAGRGLREIFRPSNGLLALPFLALFALRSMTEVSVLDYHDVEWTLFVLVAAKLAAPRDRA